MKESEFIELLNRYLDHEISAADAARLEAEVQGNLARRKIYRQYCQMQKACKLLATDFQTEAASAADRKIVDFQNAAQRKDRSSGFYTLGAFAAAAACVAIIFVGRNREQASATNASHQPAFAAQTAPAAPAAPMAMSAREPAPERARAEPRQYVEPQVRASFVNAPLTLSGNAQAQALAASAVDQPDTQFDWIQKLRIAPMQQPQPVNELSYQVRPAMLQTETQSRTYHSGRPIDPDAAQVVLRFQK